MADRRVLGLWIALGAASAVFLLWNLPAASGFVLGLRATKLAALLVVGVSTALATALFQVVANNRILTPSIMGFDALFVLMQTGLVWAIGVTAFASLASLPKFLAEVLAMMVVATVLFGTLLGRGRQDIHRMILTGVILGILFRSLAGFLQRMLDPNAFAVVQGASFASFSDVERTLLLFSAVLIGGASLLIWRIAPVLDIMALGRTRAVALGVGYERMTLCILALVALLGALALALVGPMSSGPAFLGLIGVTFAHALVGGARQGRLLLAAALFGALILVVGQTLFERALGLQSALSVVIEFGGGLLFMGLLLRGRVR
jgi:iron complex transport system permease protein